MGKPAFLQNAAKREITEEDKKRAAGLSNRQYVRFAFYKVHPDWRRLEPELQAEQKKELLAVITGFNRKMLLRPYSTMGTRADAELLLWQISESPVAFQELAAAIMQTRMGGYLELSYSFLSQTKRSIYSIPDTLGNDDSEERLVIDPTESKYLFIYPFVKTREWYQLSTSARQGMMTEHITVGRKYPSIKLNTTYSFGLDDYEFIVAFETDEPSDFLDLVEELRSTTVSMYTLSDTPLFTCMNMRLDQAVDALGGPKIAEEIKPGEEREVWIDVCPKSELPSGKSKIVYLEGKQVGVFNIGGEITALNNRCSHARGPLTDGEINEKECSVVCPWHYAKFDLKTGKVIDGIASSDVSTFNVKISENDMISVGTVVKY